MANGSTPRTHIVMDAADFWRLRAIGAACQAAEAEASVALLKSSAAVAAARDERTRVFADLATKYGFDRDTQSLTCDDKTLSVTVGPTSAPGT